MSIFAKTLRNAFGARRRNPVLDYLNASVSIADLERRQREIDAGILKPRNYPF